MKKSIVCMLILTSIALTGCTKSSSELLSYETNVDTLSHSYDYQLTQGDFFAKNIVVISEEENQGQDELLTSGATLFIDITHGNARYANHIYDKMYPASLTKLMTALVVLKYGELTDMVTISNNATNIAASGAKVCGFKEGDNITLEALLNCLLIYSGNDAAIAIAEHVARSEEEFVTLMNEEARKLGAVHSNFINCHGLHDDNQYTTAYDMYLIINQLLSYDTFRNIISKSEYKVSYKTRDQVQKEKTLKTTNDYLSSEEQLPDGFQVLGGITGATKKAGKCMILVCKDQQDTEYISLILQAPDYEALYAQMNHLLTK